MLCPCTIHSLPHGSLLTSACSSGVGLDASVFQTPSQRLEQGVVACWFFSVSTDLHWLCKCAAGKFHLPSLVSLCALDEERLVRFDLGYLLSCLV